LTIGWKNVNAKTGDSHVTVDVKKPVYPLERAVSKEAMRFWNTARTLDLWYPKPL
jgi:hypothetical protein